MEENDFTELIEGSIVRRNLLDNVNYRPYCGGYNCYNPRTELRDDGQFICPNCKWITQFPSNLIAAYKKRHNLK